MDNIKNDEKPATGPLNQALSEVSLNLISLNGLLTESVSIQNLQLSLQLYANSLIRFQKAYDIISQSCSPPLLSLAEAKLFLDQKLTIHFTIARMIFANDLLEYPFNAILPCTTTVLSCIHPNQTKTAIIEAVDITPKRAAKKLDSLFASSDKKAELLFIALNPRAVIQGAAYQAQQFCACIENVLTKTLQALNNNQDETKNLLKEFSTLAIRFYDRINKLPIHYQQVLSKQYFKINQTNNPIISPSKKHDKNLNKLAAELPELILYFMDTIMQATLQLPHDTFYQKTAAAIQGLFKLFHFDNVCQQLDAKIPPILNILKSDSNKEAYAQIVIKHIRLFSKHFTTLKFLLDNRHKTGIHLAQLPNTLAELMHQATALAQLLCGKHHNEISGSTQDILQRHFTQYDGELLALLHSAFQPLAKHCRYKHLPMLCAYFLEQFQQSEQLLYQASTADTEECEMLTTALCQHISHQLIDGDYFEQDSIKRIFSTLYTLDQLPHKFSNNAPKAYSYILYIKSAVLKFYYFIIALPEIYQIKIEEQFKEKNMMLSTRNLYIAIFKYFHALHAGDNQHPFAQGAQMLFHVIDPEFSSNCSIDYQAEDIAKIAEIAKPYMEPDHETDMTSTPLEESTCTIL